MQQEIPEARRSEGWWLKTGTGFRDLFFPLRRFESVDQLKEFCLDPDSPRFRKLFDVDELPPAYTGSFAFDGRAYWRRDKFRLLLSEIVGDALTELAWQFGGHVIHAERTLFYHAEGEGASALSAELERFRSWRRGEFATNCEIFSAARRDGMADLRGFAGGILALMSATHSDDLKWVRRWVEAEGDKSATLRLSSPTEFYVREREQFWLDLISPKTK